MVFALKNNIVLITGGAGEIGLNIANFLFNLNYKIIIFDYNDENFDKINPNFECHKVDTTCEKSVNEKIEYIIKLHENIDILINNCGMIHNESLINLLKIESPTHSYDNFKKVINNNLYSTFLVTSIVAKNMVYKRKNGCIINISSICAKGNVGQTAYSAAKAGVESMTKVWAKELGPLGIRCNAIAPGFFDTNSTKKSLNQTHIETIKTNVPLMRLGKSDEISDTVLYLIKNEYINGSIINLDGGLTI